MHNCRILFITSGLYFDPTDEATRLRYELFSEKGYSGAVLCVVYDRKYLGYGIGSFELEALYLPKYLQGYGAIRGVIRAVYFSIYCIIYGVRKRHKFNISAAVDTFKSGALCYFLNKLTGIPYIVEVMGNYIRSFSVNEQRRNLFTLLKLIYIRSISSHVLKHALGVKLLYERQLDGLVRVVPKKIFVFHDVTLTNSFKPSSVDKKVILSIGHPWYLKGMDIIIKAFLHIYHQIPDYHLHIVGYCEDVSYYKTLAAGNSNIHFYNNGMPFQSIINEIESCSMLVLASRTEAMGRVLLEAMASAKPIIASSVDGIPRIINNNINGLLFEPEDVMGLAEHILSLIFDIELSSRLSTQGHIDIDKKFSQNAFVEKYSLMLDSVLAERYK